MLHQTVPLLIVSDIVRSRDFYCDGLGFRVAERWETEGRLAWCWLEQDSAALMLQQACDEDPPTAECGGGVTFYFLCDDAQAVFEQITARGVSAAPPTTTFYGMQQTFVTDPDGYTLCFENRAENSPDAIG